MIKYKCKFCRATLESPDEHAGRSDVCPMCRRSLVVPTQSPVGKNRKALLQLAGLCVLVTCALGGGAYLAYRDIRADSSGYQPKLSQYDVELAQALENGQIELTVQGNGLFGLAVQLRSTSKKTLSVGIEPGTLLQPDDPEVQHMIVTGAHAHVFVLRPGAECVSTIPCVCIEMHERTPKQTNTFTVFAEWTQSEDSKLKRLIELDIFGPMVITAQSDQDKHREIEEAERIHAENEAEMFRLLGISPSDGFKAAQAFEMLSRRRNIDRLMRDGQLMRLLGSPTFQAAPARLQQYAVWTLTDNPPSDGYAGISSSSRLPDGTVIPPLPLFDPVKAPLEDVARLFNEAGLDPQAFHAFQRLTPVPQPRPPGP